MTGYPTDSPGELARAIGLAKAGDLAAYERIIRHYERRVFLTALRILGNPADAQDAAQEVWLRLHRSLGKIRAGEDPTGWVYRVTVNVCRDALRARPGAVALEDVPEPVAGPDAESGFARRERRAVLESALRNLAPKERAAVVLRDLEGLTTAEVAAALGSSEATVRSQISTARAKIKRFVEGFLRRKS